MYIASHGRGGYQEKEELSIQLKLNLLQLHPPRGQNTIHVENNSTNNTDSDNLFGIFLFPYESFRVFLWEFFRTDPTV